MNAPAQTHHAAETLAAQALQDFLMRKRFAVFRLADAHGMDVDAVRSAFSAGWLTASQHYDPRRGALLDTYASSIAEGLLLDERYGRRGDAMRAAFVVDSSEISEIPDRRLDPAEFLGRLADRQRGERRADRHAAAVLRCLQARMGKADRQLARVAKIVASGGDRNDVAAALRIGERRARQLIDAAASAVLALAGEVAA